MGRQTLQEVGAKSQRHSMVSARYIAFPPNPSVRLANNDAAKAIDHQRDMAFSRLFTPRKGRCAKQTTLRPLRLMRCLRHRTRPKEGGQACISEYSIHTGLFDRMPCHCLTVTFVLHIPSPLCFLYQQLKKDPPFSFNRSSSQLDLLLLLPCQLSSIIE